MRIRPVIERNSYNERKIYEWPSYSAGKMQTNSVLSAIKDAFIDNMPVVIWAAFCTLFQFVLCQTGGVPDLKTEELIYCVSLANVPGSAWLQSLTPILTMAV